MLEGITPNVNVILRWTSKKGSKLQTKFSYSNNQKTSRI